MLSSIFPSEQAGDHVRQTITVRAAQTRFRKKNLRSADCERVRSTCPACESSAFVPVVDVCPAGQAAVLQRSFCRECGHYAFSRMPSQEWFVSHYRHEFETERAAPDAPPRWDYSAISDLLHPLLGNANRKILDVGCGYGSALQHFRQLGYSLLYGVEPSDRRAQVAARAGFHIFHGSAENISADVTLTEAAPFDAIFSWHAFEHIFDIQAAVKKLIALLAPGGVLFICVPNAEAEHLIQMGHYLPHIHSFSAESLRALMELNGLSVIYEDPSLRLVARKIDAHTCQPHTTATNVDQLARYRMKFLRDFGFRARGNNHSDRCLVPYTDFRGGRETLEPSFGDIRPLSELRLGALLRVTMTALQRVNTPTGFHYANKITQAVNSRIAAYAVQHRGPFLYGEPRFALPQPHQVPVLQMEYEGEAIVAWYK